MRLLRTGLLILAASSAAAQVGPPPASATIEPAEIAAGQTAILRVEIPGTSRVSAPPTFEHPGFEVVAGPSIENRFEWINGRTSSRTVFTYRLRAIQPGPASAGPFRTADGSGKTIEIAAAIARIVAARPGEELRSGGSPTADPALVERIDPPSPYAGEQSVWTLYLVTRGEPTHAEVKSLPDFKGFWAEDLEREQNIASRTWMVNGALWRAYAIARKALFPIRPGAFSIGTARALVSMRTDIFDLFAESPFGENRLIEREAPPLPVTCRSLPAETSGLPVGSFTLKSAVDRTSIRAGESATVSATISGDGRLAALDPPALSVPGARVSEPESRLNLKRSSQRVTGTRLWEWVVTPEHAGVITVPSLSVDTFDPSAGRPRRLSTAAASLQVAAAPPAAIAEAAPAPVRPAAPAERAGRSTQFLQAGTAVAASIILLSAGYWLGGRRKRAAVRTADAPGMTAEARAAQLLERIVSAAGDRAGEAAGEIAACARRLDGVRFGPQIAGSEEEAARLEADLRRLARKLGVSA